MAQTAIQVNDVWKSFRRYHEKNQYLKTAILRGGRTRYDEFWALKGVSLEVPTGSTFGIIGANGSGKSTLLKCLVGIISPDTGHIATNGRIAALLELGAGFHPELSGMENIFMNAAILGMTRKEIASKVDDIVEFSGLKEFIDSPVKSYSSGMVVRLGFAVATSVDPEILIIDEVLAVGDAAFQQKCQEKIEDFRNDGRTIVLVSHNVGEVARLCETVAWIDKGSVKAIGNGYDVVNEYVGVAHDAVEHIPNSNEKRWGTGEAIIESVEITDMNNKPVTTIVNGMPGRIRVHYSALAPIPNAITGLGISHLHGALVWLTSNVRSGPSARGLYTSGTVEFEFESFPLLSGTYDLSVALMDASQVVHFDHREKILRFEVHHDDITENGLVGIDGTWASITGS